MRSPNARMQRLMRIRIRDFRFANKKKWRNI